MDLLVQHGGTAILSETPEIYGVEHTLTRRAREREVGEKQIERIRWWKDVYTVGLEYRGGRLANCRRTCGRVLGKEKHQPAKHGKRQHRCTDADHGFGPRRLQIEIAMVLGLLRHSHSFRIAIRLV
jgi:hypothetical protein